MVSILNISVRIQVEANDARRTGRRCIDGALGSGPGLPRRGRFSFWLAPRWSTLRISQPRDGWLGSVSTPRVHRIDKPDPRVKLGTGPLMLPLARQLRFLMKTD
jgi:hypothetical protein